VSEISIQKLSWQDLLRDNEHQFIHSCVPFAHMRDILNILKTEGYLLGVITLVVTNAYPLAQCGL